MVDGSLLEAGEYTLWTIPNKDSWKPKMIFINCSGGGMRASYLTFHTLNLLDNIVHCLNLYGYMSYFQL